MSTKARYESGILREFDDQQKFETVLANAPVFFQEDFVGAGHSAGIPAAASPAAGYPWVKKIVGAAPPTVALVANAAGGQVALTLLSNSEKEDAALYWNDNLAMDLTKKASFEFVAALSVLPSAAVQAVMGFQSAWADGPDNGSFYIGFGWLANGNLLIRSKDGVTTSSIAAAPAGGAAIVTDTAQHVYRVDMSDVNDVSFWVDGVRVNAVGSITFKATGSNAVLQPYASVYKASGVGVGTLTIDKIDVWGNRS